MARVWRVVSPWVLVAVAASGASIATGPAAAAAQTFEARVDLVHVPAIVTGRDGRTITGLTADDFEILDNGRRQPIVSFAEGAPGASVPLYLGVLLDRSRSMDLDAKLAADAVIRFVEAMPEAADVTLVEFDTSIRIGRFSPDSYEHLFSRIRTGTTGEETALFDAIGRYAVMTRDRPGLHLLVIYTDGGDSGRGLRLNEVQTLLRQTNVLVYGVVYLDNQASSLRLSQRTVMARLTQETGGEAFFPPSSRELPSIYERIRNEIASRYTLGYALPADAEPGRYRRVTVRLRGDNRDGRRVRTRAGYVVPGP